MITEKMRNTPTGSVTLNKIEAFNNIIKTLSDFPSWLPIAVNTQ